MIVSSDIELINRFNRLTKEESKQIFSKTLKYFRINKGFSQNKLAKELNISFQQIQKYENGKVKIPTERLFRVCSILNISFKEFLERGFGENLN